jgi:DNA transposition AAA+ family ATPase
MKRALDYIKFVRLHRGVSLVLSGMPFKDNFLFLTAIWTV